MTRMTALFLASWGRMALDRQIKDDRKFAVSNQALQHSQMFFCLVAATTAGNDRVLHFGQTTHNAPGM
jgi:hypothetical protein